MGAPAEKYHHYFAPQTPQEQYFNNLLFLRYLCETKIPKESDPEITVSKIIQEHGVIYSGMHYGIADFQASWFEAYQKMSNAYFEMAQKATEFTLDALMNFWLAPYANLNDSEEYSSTNINK